MAEEPKKRKMRTQFLVNIGLQYRYIGFIVISLVVISFVMSAFLYYNSYNLALELRELAMGNEQLAEQLRTLPTYFIVRMLIAMVAVIVAVVIIGILEIHKIAGPLFRLTRQVKALAEGNRSQRFILRDRDELKELAAVIDELQSDLVGREASLTLRVDKLSQKISALSKQVERGTFEKKIFQESIAEINALVSELKKPEE